MIRPPSTSAPGSFRVEAETFARLAGFEVASNGAASGGANLQAGDDGLQVASLTFEGPSGLYDLGLGYFDETDGVSSLEVRVNGTFIEGVFLDDGGSAIADLQSAATLDLAGVALQTGDVVTIRGVPDAGERLRVDFLDFAPLLPPEPVLIEAEDFQALGGYRVDPNGRASGGELIRTTSSATGSATTSFDGPAGTYDVEIAYFDESDGASTASFLLNGAELDSWTWDAPVPDTIVTEATKATRLIEGVTLAPGDTIGLSATPDGGEPARFDFVSLTPVVPAPSRTLDLTTLAGGDFQPLLGNGDGTFEAGPVSPGPGGRQFLLGDLDGDGLTDILSLVPGGLEIAVGLGDGTGAVTFAAPETLVPSFGSEERVADAVLGDSDGDGDLDLFASYFFGTDVFLNDGSGTFMSSGLEIFAENADEIAPTDIDGDGDLDLAIGEVPSQSVYILLNDGAGNFALGPDTISTADGIDLIAADMNGDGFGDLVVESAEESGTVTVEIGDGAGSFQRVFTAESETSSFTSFAVGDFDGDGDNDLVTLDFDASEDQLVFFDNELAGGIPDFTQSFALSGVGTPNRVVAADIDDDGTDELFIAGILSGGVTGLRQLERQADGSWVQGGTIQVDDTFVAEFAFLDEPVAAGSAADPAELLLV